ncbi:hypothetical protein JCM10207_003087 [Rhodosporidiobolus poonsookiae]
MATLPTSHRQPERLTSLAPPIEDALSTRRSSQSASDATTLSLTRPPKSSRRPKSSPLLSPSAPLPTSTSTLAPPVPPLPVAAPSLQRPDLAHRSSSAHSTASASKRSLPPVHSRMLPTHPSVLPPLYDSTASTTEDDDADSERDFDEDSGSIASSLLSERRRREEARAIRRRIRAAQAAHSSSSTSRMRAATGAAARPIAEKKPATWAAPGAKMPTVAGREGLGFVIEGLGDADYDAVIEGTAFQTYNSSLGSGVSSASSPANSPSLTRPARHLAVTEQNAVTFGEANHPRSPASLHAHFLPGASDGHVRFEYSQRSPRERNSSVGSYVALQPEHIVFPEVPSAAAISSPLSPESRRTSTAASLFSNRTATLDSPATSAAPSPRHASPALSQTRARSPRLPAGPNSLIGETIANRAATSRLYFPSPPIGGPPRSPAPSNASTPSLVFPSRPQTKPPTRASHSPALSVSSKLYFPSPPSSSTTAVFPSRQRTPSEPDTAVPPGHRTTRSSSTTSSSTFSHAMATAPFPPPPSHSPHARYLAKAGASSLPPPAAVEPDLPISPSFASAMTAIEPVFPSLGARLADDGIVRADVANRRVSKAPWELPPGTRLSDEEGDELDRMMRAQRRTAPNEKDDRDLAKAREQRRKSIHAELLRQTVFPPASTRVPPMPKSPLLVEDDAFHRALLEADTVKKSLGSSLLSDSVSSRRPSPVYGDNLGSPAADAESERSESLVNGGGMSPSSSTSSHMSLPLFPDVPGTHSLQVFPSPAARHRLTPPHAHASLSDSGEPLETLEEGAITAHGGASYMPSGMVAAQDFAEYEPAASRSSRAAKRFSHVSETGSQFVDADEGDDAADLSARALQEVPIAPVAVKPVNTAGDHDGDSAPGLVLAKQQTSKWVLDTLASGTGVGRSLNDIGEEGEEEEVEAIRHSRLVSNTTSSPPVTPLISAFPSIPRTSPGSARSPRQRELSAGSSIQAPPSPRLYRAVSPAPSATSRSSANSSAAVSYTVPRRNAPTSSTGFVKPKLSLGRKLGSLFSAGGSGSTASHGISSRDIIISHASMTDDPFAAPATPTSEWDTRTSLSAGGVEFRATPATLGDALNNSTSMSSSLATATATERSDATATEAEKENAPAPPATGGLSDLLSRFAQEEKVRIKGIAQAKAQEIRSGAVVAQAPPVVSTA